MAVDLEKLEKNFAKDLSEMQAIVRWRVEKQLYGTFSERRPDLGKMRTCPHCHTRRREFAHEKCCNHNYATSQRAYDESFEVRGEKPTKQEPGYGPTTRHIKGFHQVECVKRMIDPMFPQSFLKRFGHKKHGQNRQFHIRQTIWLMQNSPIVETTYGVRPDKEKPDEPLKPVKIQQAVLEAAIEMHVPLPKPEHIPQFGGNYWLWKQKRIVKAARKFRKGNS